MAWAGALTAILVALSVLQIALVFGAPLGRFAWGGQHRILPTRLRFGSAVSIAVYALIDLVAWDRVGALDVLPDGASRSAMWVVAAFFAIGVLANAASRSRPERYTMAPVSLALTLLSVLIAAGVGEPVATS